ncbi:MAG: AAA family ATPase [Acidobacteria bacterium]|nr:AAA family ATPase [Acidobacteriota bacterium]
MPAAPPLRVDLLGGFRVLVGGRPPARPPSARQQQILAYLVLHGRRGAIPRQKVSGSLWPESSDEQALTNLRRELHHLREHWSQLDALVDAGSRTLAWREDGSAAVDLLAFEEAAERGLKGDAAALRRAADLYHGDLLPDSAGEWIDADRERLRQRAKQVLARLVALLEGQRAFGDAIERAQQLLGIDPIDEEAWCSLMRSHARRGERATALHLYQKCATVLKRELGVGPNAATRLTYREIVDLGVEAPPDTPAPRTSAYPLVGRQSEWRVLVDGWRAAAAGRSRLFVIRGEAGIGKTRLTEELSGWAGLNGVAAASARCYAGEGGLAYAPLAAWLRCDALRPSVARLSPLWMSDVTRLCPELLAGRPDVAPPGRTLESWQRLQFFEAVAQAFHGASPLVLVLDDLQWADGDTLDWLQYFVRSASDSCALVVGTVRAEEEQDNAHLVRLLRQLEHDQQVTAITLGPLDRTATAQLAGFVAEAPLDDTALAQAFRETEGHPLFIIERGRMERAREPGAQAPAGLPQVQAIVAARLALLSPDARAAAEVAAVVGRDFRFDILAHASDLEEDALVRSLDELWRRYVVRAQDDERWDFSHDRIREVAYAGIGPARRRLIHRRIAQAMELLFADRLDEVSASIAAHLEGGGQPARALPYLDRAAEAATRLSATEEAIRCLTHALALLETLPAGRDRDDRELALRSSLSVALNSGRGYAAREVEENLERVFALARPGGHGPMPARWLWAAFTMRFMLGDMRAMREVSEEVLAQAGIDPSNRCAAHHAMAGTLWALGELDGARRHFEAALAAYDERHPQRSALGSDLGVFCHAWYTQALWLLGDEAGAVAHADEAIALARRLDHPYSQTLAFAYAALLHQMRGDAGRVVACAEEAVAFCARHGFAYYGDWARVLVGWSRGLERPADGIAIIESALEQLDRQRAQARRPYYLSLLAATSRRHGDRGRAVAILDAAAAMALDRGEVWWLPDLYLQQSELADGPERGVLWQRALDLARAQNSRGLERRILASAPAPA